MKRMLVKIVSVCLTLVLFCSIMFIPSFAVEDSVEEDDMLALLSEKVCFENGELRMDYSDESILDMNPELLKSFAESLEKVNALLASGELCITENGTLYEAADDELVVQGGNITKTVWHLWGMEFYFQHELIPSLVQKLSKLGNYSNYGTIIGSVVCCFPPAVAVGAGILLGFGLGSFHISNLVTDLNYYYSISSRGIIISAWWIPKMSVSLQ